MQEKLGYVNIDTDLYDGYDAVHEEEMIDELLRVAEACDEEELNREISERRCWPMLYHFSHVRENIVTWLPVQGDERVLELGAACGAVTGGLCRLAGRVVSIDPSLKRSQVNAYRHRKLQNLEIRVGDFKAMEPQLEQFDLITMIGSFECARDYMQPEETYSDFLQTLLKHLKPGGRLMIAIDNRLGLKYFAGHADGHTGHYFKQIGNPSEDGNYKLFSKAEWDELLGSLKGIKSEIYYPYPDYRFPMAIYSDEWLPKTGELNNLKGNYDHARVDLFDEGKAFDDIIKNGTFAQFANAYIILLEREG